jgi:hypothetical protein
MVNEFSKEPIDVANESGFPLQIAIIDTIKQTGWKILDDEHPWRSEDRELEGFIDVIAEKNMNPGHDLEVMVIECKRVRKAAWVFFSPLKNDAREHVRIWGSNFIGGTSGIHTDLRHKWKKFGWENLTAYPISYESKYCAIPGQEQGRKTLLERTAADLVESVEAFALEEKRTAEKHGQPFSRLYTPVIVTTARLFIIPDDPNNISLVDGSLLNKADEHKKEVPYVRFRNSLDTFGSVAESERTVFVVNAQKFFDFLSLFKINE